MQFHSTEMIMSSIRRYAMLSAVGATITLATASMAAAQDETCGAYKYHDEHTGRCVDREPLLLPVANASDRKSKSFRELGLR